jgi:hypothetical protein
MEHTELEEQVIAPAETKQRIWRGSRRGNLFERYPGCREPSDTEGSPFSG